ncbi:MAG: hypothetical protein NXH88_03600 [Hyphomonas sp.]|nr:hypothetical protein [Hyphomonas sp.]
MAAKRKPELHYTGDAKMKAAALKTSAKVKPVQPDEDAAPVPSPAKQLQDQLEAHYQPLSQRMSVILVSLLVGFAFIGGWLGGTGGGLV